MKWAFALLLLTAAAAGLWAGGLSLAQGGEKVIVCKYVGTPGVDERLQTGDNPISVSANALEGKGFTGSFPFEFSDAQGRSVAVRFAVGNERGSLSDCPGGTTSSTTTTTTPTTTTPTTTGTPRETFFAGAVCDLANSRYVVSGEVDGQPATVIPQFIPGDKQGTSLVIVTLGSFTGVATVNTAGTCVATTSTAPGTTTSPGGGGSGGGGTTSISSTTSSSAGTSTLGTTSTGATTSTTSNGTTPNGTTTTKESAPPPDNFPSKPKKPTSPRPNGAPCVIKGHPGMVFRNVCHPVVAGKG